MDKNREGERGDKRTPGLPQGLDPATAALYANMLGGGMGAYAAAAAGMGGMGGQYPGYPPVSSAAGFASLAAAQQQAQQAAALALGPSAAWWNLANLQQMELLSRLGGGGMGGQQAQAAQQAAAAAALGGYAGLHPEHLLNLEMLQAQHAMAAVLQANASKSSHSSTSSSLSLSHASTSRGSSSTTKPSSSSSHRLSQALSSRPSSATISPSHMQSSHHGSPSTSRSSSRDPLLPPRSQHHLGGGRPELDISRLASSSRSHSSPHGYGRSHLMSGLERGSPSPHSVGGSSLSYGIANLMGDKLSSHKPSQSPQSESPSSKRSGSNGVSISKAIRNKELEIIPISPSTPKSSTSAEGLRQSSIPSFHRDKSDPKVSISAIGNSSSGLQLSNGILGRDSLWKEEAKVSIEPCSAGGAASLQAAVAGAAAAASGGGDDGPLNLSMKSSGVSAKSEYKDRKEGSSGFPGIPQGLHPFLPPGNLGSELTPSLEMLQSLYGGHQTSNSVNVLASMQDALQRQLLAADEKKREEKKKRMEEAQERARHLGRGVSKPKKNTVASLLEHCRAAGIKPQLPLPDGTSSSSLPLPPTISTTPSVSISPVPLPSSSGASSLGGSTSLSIPSSTTITSLPSVVTLPPSLTITSVSQNSDVLSLSAVTTATTTVPHSLVITTTTSSLTVTTTVSDAKSVDATPVVVSSPLSPMSPTENGGAVVRKRHVVTSSSVDGRLVTTIKMAATPAPPTELSDGSDSEESDSSMSTLDEEGLDGNRFPSPWLKRSSNHDGTSPTRSTGSPPPKKRKMITDEAMLRIPLMYGWRRETSMRGVTQSGVRGEVVYHAPCGKTFRQYPDIIRYLERHNINEVTRDNFSFSSKIPIGEYTDANTGQGYSETEVRNTINDIRKKKGYRPQHFRHRGDSNQNNSNASSRQTSPKPTGPKNTPTKTEKQNEEDRDALEKEAELILRRLEAEEKLQKIKSIKDHEKGKKHEDGKKDRDDKEGEKGKHKLLKEQILLQELNKQKEMLYALELERERRRYHGVLVKALENRKRYEDREKRREELREEKRMSKERKKEERMAAKELNILLKETKEDMELTDHQELPVIPRLQGLKLPPEAFGNALMIFEFLHNFGETLGFDMDSLPSLQSLQLALMNEQESEEELLSVLSHLLVCAIEDPGIPNPQKHTTMLGQTLNRADITPTNISEILRVYLYANATGEVRVIYGPQCTDKDKRDNPAKAQEWEDRLDKNETYRMSQWLSKLPFLALNATQKSEVIAYVCNELLQNKAVVRQIEDSLDRHNGLKTEKWKVDAQIRKITARLRMSINRKKLAALKNSCEMGTLGAQGGEDSNMSAASAIAWESNDKTEKKEGEEDDVEEEDHENDSGNDSDPMEELPDEEDINKLSTEDATKTLELLQRQMNQVRQELFETAQQVRGYNCGQDRFKRTMWVLPHAGGPFLEGLSSCDYTGRAHFPLEIPSPIPKEGHLLQDIPNTHDYQPKEEKEEQEKDASENPPETNGGVKKEDDEDVEMKEEKLVNGDPPEEKINPRISLLESIDFPDIPCKREADVKVKEEGTSPINGMKETPQEGVDKDLAATGLGLIPGQYLRPEHLTQCEKLYFSLFPRNVCELKPPQMTPKHKQHGPNSPSFLNGVNGGSLNALGMQNLSHKELLERLHQSAVALPIPTELKTGWWHFTDLQLLKEMLESLNERGVRERELKRFIEKNLNIVKNAVAKVDTENVQLEPCPVPEEEAAVLYDDYGTPVIDEAVHWSSDIAFKVELATLEAVYNMEEKITNASMQNKSWRLGESGDRPPPSNLRASCLPPLDKTDLRLNPIHLGRDRLLALEEGIERRYLKPPLGNPPNPKSSGENNVEQKPCTESPKGLSAWREAVAEVETAAQLAMCMYQLETAVAWDKSIMKAVLQYCQFCHSGDFEEKLLLCDGCDKGYHTHCFKPAMTNIPDGDWYCYECVNKFNEGANRHCLVCGGTEGRNLVSCAMCFRAYHGSCITPNLVKIPRNKWHCPQCASKVPRGRRGRAKKVSTDSSSTLQASPMAPPTPSSPSPCINNNNPPSDPPPSNTPPLSNSSAGSPSSPGEVPAVTEDAPTPPAVTPKKERKNSKQKATPVPREPPRDMKDLVVCKDILSDLESHDDAWPFLLPVNTRQFPTYKKIIKKPMDLSTIRKKLEDTLYKSREDYCEDLRLMFNNCEVFNEDDSPVGKAGHSLRSFFETKWNDAFPAV